MERLVSLLGEVNASDIESREVLNNSHHPAVPLIRELLCDLLISENGTLNWAIKEELDRQKIWVYPVERDSFGWVLGAVDTKKGAITFG